MAALRSTHKQKRRCTTAHKAAENTVALYLPITGYNGGLSVLGIDIEEMSHKKKLALL